jgi:hypothetical protein
MRWIEWAQQADPRVRPLLLSLLCHRDDFTAEAAKFLTAGILADKDAVKAYADGYDSGVQKCRLRSSGLGGYSKRSEEEDQLSSLTGQR